MAYILLEILDGFSLVWALMERYQSPHFYKWLWNLNWSKWISVVDILSQILLTLLTFFALPILRQISNYRRGFLFGSVWCELISIYTLKNQWITIVSKIWVGMSTTNIHSLPFSHLQKRGLECRYTVRTHTEEKLSKISNIKIRHFAFFSCKYLS